MFEDVRRRVREELQRLEIDACMVTTPANIFYTTGFFSPVVNLSFRLMGTDTALIPADPSLEPALMTSDFAAPAARAATSIEDIRTYRMWVENRDLDVITGPSGGDARISRPPQWDPDEIDETVTSILEERGLSAGTIGIDLRYVYADSLFRLQQNNPECQFVDVTGMLYGLRAIKHPQEIEMHRNAARLFEAGLRRAINEAREGQSAQAIKYNYQAGALEAAMADPGLSTGHGGEFQSAYGFISAGTGSSFGDDGFDGRYAAGGLHSGDLIKFDCGVAVGGFYSDCGRTFAFGRPSAEQRRVHDALAEAHAAAREIMRPGTPISALYQAADDVMRARGFPGYSRGHYGHSIGLDTFVEEPPFISANEHSELQPGMLLCLETPYYSASTGSYQIEDMILITESGHENFNTLSYELVEL
jgi:Xaa-Pro aminopeptidase